jgi:hypothetical protein
MFDMKPCVCIVGSGPGGAIAAIQLARSGLFRTILIDLTKIADDTVSSIRASELLSTINIGYPFGHNSTRGFGFGGSSELWHGIITHLDDEDWNLLDSMVGKPLSQEIKLYYAKLEDYFGKLPDRRAKRFKQRLSKQRLFGELENSGEFVSKDFFLQKKPLRFRQYLLKCKNEAVPIELIENAVALSINSTSPGGDAIDSVLVDVNGKKLVIAADYFILSAGALETPRIVLQSIQEQKVAIKNQNIGRYLTDHPYTTIGKIISKKGRFRFGLTSALLSRQTTCRVGYRLSKNERAPTIGSNHCITLRPSFPGSYVEFKERLKRMIFHKDSLKNSLLFIKRLGIKNIVGFCLEFMNEKLCFGAYIKQALVMCFLEQPERKASCVTLSSTKDVSGRLIPRINWIVDEEESIAVKNITNHFADLFANSKMFSFSPSNSSVKELASGAHHAGTMRIGSNEVRGVIDSNLQVFGTSNLFVCDLSIFPNYGNSNPTFTLAAFSARLADHLILRHKSTRIYG